MLEFNKNQNVELIHKSNASITTISTKETKITNSTDLKLYAEKLKETVRGKLSISDSVILETHISARVDSKGCEVCVYIYKVVNG